MAVLEVRRGLAGLLHEAAHGCDLFPDTTDDVPVLAGVDIRHGLLSPSANVTSLVPAYARLVGPLGHEDPAAVPREV